MVMLNNVDDVDQQKRGQKDQTIKELGAEILSIWLED